VLSSGKRKGNLFQEKRIPIFLSEDPTHVILSKAEGKPVPRKISQLFFQKTPTRAVLSKEEEELQRGFH